MSPCHKLTLPTRLVARKRVILDAGWPLSDGEFSRSFSIKSILSIPKVALIDLIAFHSANLILAETENQKSRISKIFLISKKRIRVSFTGFNESPVVNPSWDDKLLSEITGKIDSLGNKIIVIFRGKINNESGYSSILKAAEILKEKATFLLLVNQNSWTGFTPSNCIEINSYSNEQMFSCYRIAQIALGQISDHKRLELTIPHKAFEAAFFGKTYITNKSSGMEEFGSQKNLVFLESLLPMAIANQIIEIATPETLQLYGNALNAHYQENYSQRILNIGFEKMLKESYLQ